MSGLLVKRLINVMAISVALLVAVGIPVGYGIVGYHSENALLAVELRLDVNRLAKYIYNHDLLWVFHRVRIAELLENDENLSMTHRHRVYALPDRLVFADDRALPGPVITLASPLIVQGSPVGRVEVDASIQPVLLKTSYVALTSIAVGLCVLLFLRLIPIHFLNRAQKRLAEQDAELQKQTLRFETALENMSQGLCMFDAGRRLTVCNARYGDLYGLTAEQTRPGTGLQTILERRVATGNAPKDHKAYVESRIDAISRKEPHKAVIELADGRFIAIVHQPMPGGGWVATHEDVTDRKRAEQQIEYMAHHDALTGLSNRVQLRNRLGERLTGLRTGENLAVVCLDLDHFKRINDTLGHPLGDALLRQVAARLLRCVRPADLVSRLGGDEFAIVQVATDQPGGALLLAQRIIDALNEPFDLGGQQVVIGVSLGVALAPTDGDDVDQLLKNADMALYRAKADGRNTYCFFEKAMDAKMQARRMLEVDLRRAIAAGEFELFYQPIVNVATNEISGFEALLRWNHPTRGRVMPDQFIAIAEEIGLIVPIGEWVLRQACHEAAGWPEEIKIAVNLSPVQFRNKSLVNTVVSAVAAAGLSPPRLELEITEAVLIQDTDVVTEALHQLRSFGVRIAMDDFGTGYSSLSYLRQFPFDKIKIDKGFVQRSETETDSFAIVQAVIGLGKALGMTTTAEGVESTGQLKKLQIEGCAEVQGYLFSKPMPASKARQMISAFGSRLEAAVA